MSQLLYQPSINACTRFILKPFAAWLPTRLKFPISGKFTVVGRTVPRFKMLTNPTSAVTKFVFWGNVEGFEYNAIQVFLELAKTSKVFFDIGSNIGYYALLAAAVTDNKIRTYAFEPMPSAYDYLEQNIEINKFNFIQAFQLALSDTTGTAVFHAIKNPKFASYPQLTGDGSLNGNSSHNASKEQFDVAIDTLDHFVTEHLRGEKVDLIKLDTEANEHKVLAGATHVLTVHRPIIQCEILKNQIEAELEEVLKPHHYLYFRATAQGLRKVESLLNNSTPYHDHYLVPEEKMELIRATGFLLNS